MATKKAATKPKQMWSVTATIDSLTINVGIEAENMDAAVEKSKSLKLGDFIKDSADVYDCDKLEITSIWKD